MGTGSSCNPWCKQSDPVMAAIVLRQIQVQGRFAYYGRVSLTPPGRGVDQNSKAFHQSWTTVLTEPDPSSRSLKVNSLGLRSTSRVRKLQNTPHGISQVNLSWRERSKTRLHLVNKVH